MFGLEGGLLFLLLFSLFAACAFEFVNGFHDTANAVATVIYTRSLKPQVAVIWSGFCNFLGVNIGGIGVAMGILNLLPTDLMVDHNIAHGMSMIMALLLSAIIWNLGTWWLGLPASSSHTLIGSILGVGLGHGFLSGGGIQDSVNWHKASEIGQSLLFSPIFGFAVAYGLLALMLKWLRKTQPVLFQEPPKDQSPPILIRLMLFVTCSLVSFFHGSNDGQKGVGLVMLILIVLVPGYFALDNSLDISKLQFRTSQVAGICSNNSNTNAHIRTVGINAKLADSLAQQMLKVDKLKQADHYHNLAIDLRTAIVKTTKGIDKIEQNEANPADLKILKAAQKDLKPFIEYAPKWVIIMISICLGLGTMVGWKRIVITIGEKIGKEHLTYAQGAVAELMTAVTIWLSTELHLPVSTTHVLSSGIAGTMVATNGAKNLQAKTLKNIALAWVLTLPVTILMSCGLFMLIWNLLK